LAEIGFYTDVLDRPVSKKEAGYKEADGDSHVRGMTSNVRRDRPWLAFKMGRGDDNDGKVE
jgi:hypothetical protein